jgi:hypothetical protein
MSRVAFRINVRVFTGFLVVGLLLLAISSLFVLGIGQGRLRESYGASLSQVADHTAAAVDAYMFRRIIDASILARVPDVRDEAAAGTRRPFDLQATKALDLQWQQAAEVPPALKTIFSTRASSFLAEIGRDDPVYREVLVTDRYGRIVAASSKTSDYYQADEDWWRDAFGDGVHGRLTVTDVRWDESARVFAIEIAVPVAEPSSDTLAGVLKVITDIRELGAVIGGVRMGMTGDANLLREDGSFVFSLTRVEPNARYFATDLLRERLQAVQQGQTQASLSFDARAADGTVRLVGVAFSQLKASYPQLSWVVAVSQADSELFAPLRAQWASLIIVLALTALAVVLFALWFSMRLATPPPDSELHLVEHAPAARIEG